MTVKEQREKLAALIEKGRDVVKKAEAEHRGLSAEDRAEIERIHTEAAEIKQHINLLEAQERYEAEMAAVLPSQIEPQQTTRAINDNLTRAAVQTPDRNRQGDLAMSGWALEQFNLGEMVRDEHREAMQAARVSPHQDSIQVRLPTFRLEGHAAYGTRRIDAVLNAMSVGQDTAGGYMVPEGFVRSLEVALLQYGGMRQVATILRTATGEALPYPTSNDTSNEGVEVAENEAQSTASTDPTIGAVMLYAYAYSSKFVRVSRQLIRDSAFDIPSFLGSVIGERLGRIQNRRCTTGDGAAKPKGMITSATVGRTTAAATVITADDVLRLIHSVDPAYRADPSVAFMMHDSILLEVSLLKDGNNNYLLRPDIEQGSAQVLRGYRIVNNQHMDSELAASNKVIAFGAFGKYIIREVGTMQVRRLVERFAESAEDGFLGFLDFDGGLLDAGTHPVKVIQMHT